MNEKKKLLLHSCCAPCSSVVLERFAAEYDITVFFYNPNIYPETEYQKRLSEQKRFLAEVHAAIPLIEGGYAAEDSRGRVPAYCEECFLNRLEETAKAAERGGFDCIATTLTVGSKKKAEQINPIAAAVAGKYGVGVIQGDFKKKNGYNRSVELSKKYGLYRQNYCGCAPDAKIGTLIKTLKRLYPNPQCELVYSEPHELLIATRLSAQCTDKRVNATTPELFAKYRSVGDFAVADVSDIEAVIKPCGLSKTKAADIKNMCEILMSAAKGGSVPAIPDNMEELLAFPGVGRKTANLVLGELYGQPAVVADTHVIRLSNRLGLAASKDAFKVETALREVIPPKESLYFCHRLVKHGRAVCNARKPDCAACELSAVCAEFSTNSTRENPPHTNV